MRRIGGTRQCDGQKFNLRKLCGLFALYLFMLWPLETGTAFAQEEQSEDPFEIVQEKLQSGAPITPQDIKKLSDAELRQIIIQNPSQFQRLLDAMDAADVGKVQDILDAQQISAIIDRPDILSQLDLGAFDAAALSDAVNAAFGINTPGFALTLATGSGCTISGSSLSCTGTARIDLAQIGPHNAAADGPIIGITLEGTELRLLRGDATQDIVLGNGITDVELRDGQVYIRGASGEITVDHGRVRFDGGYLLDDGTQVQVNGIAFVSDGAEGVTRVTFQGAEVRFSGNGHFLGGLQGSVLDTETSSLAFTFANGEIASAEGVKALLVTGDHRVSGDFAARLTSETIQKRREDGSVERTFTVTNLEVTLRSAGSYYQQESTSNRVSFNGQPVTVHACGSAEGFSPLCGGSQQLATALTEAKEFQQVLNSLEQLNNPENLAKVQEIVGKGGITCSDTQGCISAFQQLAEQKRTAAQGIATQLGNAVFLSADGRLWLSNGMAQVEFHEAKGAAQFRHTFRANDGSTVAYGAAGQELLLDNYNPSTVANFAELDLEVGIQELDASGEWQFRTIPNDDLHEGARFLTTRFDRSAEGRISALFSAGDLSRLQQLRGALGAGQFLAVPDFTITPMDRVNSITFNRDATQAFLSIAKQNLDGGRYEEVSIGAIQGAVEGYRRLRDTYQGMRQIGELVLDQLTEADRKRLQELALQGPLDSYYGELEKVNADFMRQLEAAKGVDTAVLQQLIEANRLSAAGDARGAIGLYDQVAGQYSAFAKERSGDIYTRTHDSTRAIASYQASLGLQDNSNVRLKLLNSYISAPQPDAAKIQEHFNLLQSSGGEIGAAANRAYGGYLEAQGKAGESIGYYAAAFQLAQSTPLARFVTEDLVRALATATGTDVGKSLGTVTAVDFGKQLDDLVASGKYAEQLKGINLAELKSSYIAAQFLEASGSAPNTDTRTHLLEQSVDAQANYQNLIQLAQAYQQQGNLALAELARQRAEQVLNEQSREAGFSYDATREQQRIGLKLQEAQLRFADAQASARVARTATGSVAAIAKSDAEHRYAEALQAISDITKNYDADNVGAHSLQVNILFTQGRYAEARQSLSKTSAAFQQSEIGKLLSSAEAMQLLAAAEQNRAKAERQRASGVPVDNFAEARASMQELEARQAAGITLTPEQQTELARLQGYVQGGDVNYLLQQVGSELGKGENPEAQLRGALALIEQRKKDFPEYASQLEQQAVGMRAELGIREAYARGDVQELQSVLAAAPAEVRERLGILEAELRFRNAVTSRDPVAARAQLEQLRGSLNPDEVATLERTIAGLEGLKDGSAARSAVQAYLTAKAAQERAEGELQYDGQRYTGNRNELVPLFDDRVPQSADALKFYMDQKTGKQYLEVTENGQTSYVEFDPAHPPKPRVVPEHEGTIQAEQQMLAALRDLDVATLQQLATEVNDPTALVRIAAVREVKERIAGEGGDLVAVRQQLSAALSAAQAANSGIGQMFRIGEDAEQEHAEQLMGELDAHFISTYAQLSDAELQQRLYQAQLARSAANVQKAIAAEEGVTAYDLPCAFCGTSWFGTLDKAIGGAIPVGVQSTNAELLVRQHEEQVLRQLVAARDIEAERPGLRESNPELFVNLVAQREAAYALGGFSLPREDTRGSGRGYSLNADAAFLQRLDPNNLATVQLRAELEQVVQALSNALLTTAAILPTVQDAELRNQLWRESSDLRRLAERTTRDINDGARDAFLERSVERVEGGSYAGSDIPTTLSHGGVTVFRDIGATASAIFDLGLGTAIRGIFGGIDAEYSTMEADRTEAQLREIQTRRALDVLAETGTHIEDFPKDNQGLEQLIDAYDTERQRDGKTALTPEQRRAVRNDLLTVRITNALDITFDPTSVVGMKEEGVLDMFSMRGTAEMMIVSGAIMRTVRAIPEGLNLISQVAGAAAARSAAAPTRAIFTAIETAFGGTARGIQAAATSNLNIFNVLNKVDDAVFGAAERAGLGTVESTFGRAMKEVLTEQIVEEIALPAAVGGAFGQHASDSLDAIEAAAGLRGRGSVSVRLTQSVDVRGNAFNYVSVNANPLTYAQQVLGPNAQIEAVTLRNGEIIAAPALTHPQAVRITEPSGAVLVIGVTESAFDQQQLKIHDDAVFIRTGSGDIRVLTAEGPTGELAQRIGGTSTAVQVVTASGEQLSGVLISEGGAQRLVVASPQQAADLRIARIEQQNGQTQVVSETVSARDQLAQNVEQLMASGRAPGIMVEAVRGRSASLGEVLRGGEKKNSFDLQLWQRAFTSRAEAAKQYAAEVVNAIKDARDARGMSNTFDRLEQLGVLNDQLALQVQDPIVAQFVREARPQVIAFRTARMQKAWEAEQLGAEAASQAAAEGKTEQARKLAELSADAAQIAQRDAESLRRMGISVEDTSPRAMTQRRAQLQRDIDALTAEFAGNLDDTDLRRELGEQIKAKQAELEQLGSPTAQQPTLEQPTVVEREEQRLEVLQRSREVDPFEAPGTRAALEAEQRIAEQRLALARQLEAESSTAAITRELPTISGDPIAALQTPDREARIAALAQLPGYATTPARQVAAVDALIAVLAQSGPLGVSDDAAFAADALGQVAAVTDAQTQARAVAALSTLATADPLIQQAAANSLRMIGTLDAAAALIPSIQSEDPVVRETAVRAVGEHLVQEQELIDQLAAESASAPALVEEQLATRARAQASTLFARASAVLDEFGEIEVEFVEPLETFKLPSQYRVGEQLGQGEYGVVYRVVDTIDGKVKAIKVFRDTQGESAEREFTIQRAVVNALHEQPAVVVPESLQQYAGRSFMAMEHIEGGTIADAIRDGDGPSPLELIRYGRDLSTALAAMHQLGYVHLDIKPENLLISQQGVKLGDFGLARPIAEAQNPDQVIVSSPLWSDRRLWTADAVGAEADVYSLGVTLYYALAGRHPVFNPAQLEGKTLDAVMEGVVDGSIAMTQFPSRPIESNEPWATQLNALVLQMLDPDPEQRPTAAAAAQQFEAIAEQMEGQGDRSLIRLVESGESPTLNQIADEQRAAFTTAVDWAFAQLTDAGFNAQATSEMSVDEIQQQVRIEEREVATAVKFQASREAIRDELRSAGMMEFLVGNQQALNAITDALALLNTHSGHYQDARRFARQMPTARGKVAALLHDIGKIGPPGLSQHTAETVAELSDESMIMDYQLQALSAGMVLELYGITTNARLDKETITIRSFLQQAGVDEVKQQRIKNELGKVENPFTGKSFDIEQDLMVMFWRAHPHYDARWLGGKVDVAVVDIAASHHIADTVNGEAVNPRSVDLATADAAMREDIIRLIVADKLDAYVHRTGLPVDAAATVTAKLLTQNRLLTPYSTEIDAMLTELRTAMSTTPQSIGAEELQISNAVGMDDAQRLQEQLIAIGASGVSISHLFKTQNAELLGVTFSRRDQLENLLAANRIRKVRGAIFEVGGVQFRPILKPQRDDYYHGSGSASIVGVLNQRSPGLKPTGQILREGRVPYSGELDRGISDKGVNVNGVSAFIDGLADRAMGYAKYSFNTEGWTPEYGARAIEKLRAELQKIRGGEEPIARSAEEAIAILERSIQIEELRIAQWGTLSAQEQALIATPFPVVYGIRHRGAVEYRSFGIGGEVVISGTIAPSNLVLYVPVDKIPLVREIVAARGIPLAGIESFEGLLVDAALNNRKSLLVSMRGMTAEENLYDLPTDILGMPVIEVVEVTARSDIAQRKSIEAQAETITRAPTPNAASKAPDAAAVVEGAVAPIPRTAPRTAAPEATAPEGFELTYQPRNLEALVRGDPLMLSFATARGETVRVTGVVHTKPDESKEKGKKAVDDRDITQVTIRTAAGEMYRVTEKANAVNAMYTIEQLGGPSLFQLIGAVIPRTRWQFAAAATTAAAMGFFGSPELSLFGMVAYGVMKYRQGMPDERVVQSWETPAGSALGVDGGAVLYAEPRWWQFQGSRVVRVEVATARRSADLRGGSTPLVAPISTTRSTADTVRLTRASELLGRSLSDAEQQAILAAHEVGRGHFLGTQNPDGTYNKHEDLNLAYTPQEIAQKVRILAEAGFTQEEREKLIRYGVAGEEAPPKPSLWSRARGIFSLENFFRYGPGAVMYWPVVGLRKVYGMWESWRERREYLQLVRNTVPLNLLEQYGEQLFVEIAEASGENARYVLWHGISEVREEIKSVENLKQYGAIFAKAASAGLSFSRVPQRPSPPTNLFEMQNFLREVNVLLLLEEIRGQPRTAEREQLLRTALAQILSGKVTSAEGDMEQIVEDMAKSLAYLSTAADPKTRYLANQLSRRLPIAISGDNSVQVARERVVILQDASPDALADLFRLWSQKVHNRPSLDDVAIAEAYLTFLDGGDAEPFLARLAKEGHVPDAQTITAHRPTLKKTRKTAQKLRDALHALYYPPAEEGVRLTTAWQQKLSAAERARTAVLANRLGAAFRGAGALHGALRLAVTAEITHAHAAQTELFLIDRALARRSFVRYSEQRAEANTAEQHAAVLLDMLDSTTADGIADPTFVHAAALLEEYLRDPHPQIFRDALGYMDNGIEEVRLQFIEPMRKLLQERGLGKKEIEQALSIFYREDTLFHLGEEIGALQIQPDEWFLPVPDQRRVKDMIRARLYARAGIPMVEILAETEQTLGGVRISDPLIEAVAAETGLSTGDLADRIAKETPEDDGCSTGGSIICDPNPNGLVSEASVERALVRVLSSTGAEQTVVTVPKASSFGIGDFLIKVFPGGIVYWPYRAVVAIVHAPSKSMQQENPLLENLVRTKLIAVGAQGEVFLMRNRETGEESIAKGISGYPSQSQQVLEAEVEQEFRIQQTVQNTRAGILALGVVHDAPGFGGDSVILMDYIEGKDLGKITAEDRPTPEEWVTLASDLSDTVAALHAQGYVHRDIKPLNVIINDNGAKLADYGIATTLRDAELRQNEVMGTPMWSDTRQLRAEPVGPEADVLALGRTLYYGLTGKNPHYDTERYRDLKKEERLDFVRRGIIEEDPAPPPPIPGAIGWKQDFNTLILQMIDLDPAKRPTMVEVKERLEGIAAQVRGERAWASEVRQEAGAAEIAQEAMPQIPATSELPAARAVAESGVAADIAAEQQQHAGLEEILTMPPAGASPLEAAAVPRGQWVTFADGSRRFLTIETRTSPLGFSSPAAFEAYREKVQGKLRELERQLNLQKPIRAGIYGSAATGVSSKTGQYTQKPGDFDIGLASDELFALVMARSEQRLMEGKVRRPSHQRKVLQRFVIPRGTYVLPEGAELLPELNLDGIVGEEVVGGITTNIMVGREDSPLGTRYMIPLTSAWHADQSSAASAPLPATP